MKTVQKHVIEKQINPLVWLQSSRDFRKPDYMSWNPVLKKCLGEDKPTDYSVDYFNK